MANNHHQLHRNPVPSSASEACGVAVAAGASWPGTSKPANWEAKLAGSVLN